MNETAMQKFSTGDLPERFRYGDGNTRQFSESFAN